jgi:hypothetical protein
VGNILHKCEEYCPLFLFFPVFSYVFSIVEDGALHILMVGILSNLFPMLKLDLEKYDGQVLGSVIISPTWTT